LRFDVFAGAPPGTAAPAAASFGSLATCFLSSYKNHRI
jgi:hypothetical protein